MPDPFSHSPLFTQASRQFRSQARADWGATEIAKLVRNVQAAGTRGTKPAAIVSGAIERFARSGDTRAVMRDLWGVDFATFTHSIERYARGPGHAVVQDFLHSMGPAGDLVWALVGGIGRGGKEGARRRQTALDRDLESAIRLLRAHGYEVLPPPGKPRANVGDMARATRAALAFLRDRGVEVGGHGARDEDIAEVNARVPGMPFPVPPQGDVVVGQTLQGEERVWSPTHPIVTGEMVDAVASSNVHSFGYDLVSKSLYVRYIDPSARKGLAEGQIPPHVPGPLYRYSDVPENLFESLLLTESKGEWLWRHIRIQGTWSGHQYDYQLVGVTGDYVPRKAIYGEGYTVTGDPQYKGQVGEWFKPRTIWTQSQRRLTSVLPVAPAPDINVARTLSTRGTTGPGG
jgi:hypothetical protein